jgi:hypothetical protein
MQASGRYLVGKPAAVQAVVVAKRDYKCNDKYPHKVVLGSPPAGVSYPEPTARRASIGKERCAVSVPFVASSVGKKTITGTFHTSVCNASSCKFDKVPVSVTVTVDES